MLAKHMWRGLTDWSRSALVRTVASTAACDGHKNMIVPLCG